MPDAADSATTFDDVETLLEECMLCDRVAFERRLRNLRKGRRRGAPAAELERLLLKAQDSRDRRRRRHSLVPPITYPDSLPITARKDEILQSFKEHPVVIVAGDTGSGKSTQIPKMCLEAGRGVAAQIACTQPRRVAATALSRRLADELGVGWGAEVGCKIRFRDHTSPDTLVKMVTDGMLVAEIRGDPDLYRYDTVIVDEAHERSLNIDYLLGYLRVLRRRRPDLKVIITSATIDTEKFSSAFDGAPVIEISGRMYPVEVRHLPLDELLHEDEDLSYVDAAVRAVVDLLSESRDGDVLLFMPGERDIRECRDLLEARRLADVEILALFSRLTSAEQQRVFNPGSARRVIVSTNVAETSITIPRIRFVVDTGLARLNRFNPRTQTQRLPIEAISQSSAQQRAGRCGRVQDGVCVRLYGEEDFQSRPRYTQPEIQRSDLAEVILRMRDLNLGEAERFPFVDPPSPQAIKAGYQSLQELGALDAQRRLTALGRDMARLPIAPTVSRMILQAKQENALREVVVIAAAISIQDPRERPLEQQEEADRSHRQLAHPESDFLTLLRIWDTYHERLGQLRTQNKMRRFCREHFLSFVRMREWRDIHEQLGEALREPRTFKVHRRQAESPASYDAVHRSIVAGLLGNVARKKEHNLYRAARNRDVMLFPGSGLFQRKASSARKDAAAGSQTVSGDVSLVEDSQGGAPSWIVASEMVETSRLFARCAARVDPTWLLELGSHLCRSSYRDPYWNRRSGRVLVRETVRLHGLELTTREIPYGRVDSTAATEMFIRDALAADDVDTPHRFLKHNRDLRERIETWQTRMRRRDGIDLEGAAVDFYTRRLTDVSSVHDLNRIIRQRQDGGDQFLHMVEADLLGDRDLSVDRESFPDFLSLDGNQVELAYAYRPGEDEDGVTIRLTHSQLDTVHPEILEWLVPGLFEEKITCLLRTLPKGIRKSLVPIPQTARAIASELEPTHPSFIECLEEFMRRRYRVDIRRSDWRPDDLPHHLRMRVEVCDDGGNVVIAGRDLTEICRRLERHDTPAEVEAWKRQSDEFSRDALTDWSIDDLPERVEVTRVSGVPLFGYPGLERHDAGAGLRLFKTRTEAEAASRGGFVRLFESVLKPDLVWLRAELEALRRLGDLYSPARDHLAADAYESVVTHLFATDPVLPLTRRSFEGRRQRALMELPAVSSACTDVVSGLLETRLDILACENSYAELADDLQRLLPDRFLRVVPFERLGDLARFLKAVLIRAERSRLDPSKDVSKAEQVSVYADRLHELLGEELVVGSRRRQLIDEFGWLLEEWRVSVFAQELGTPQPVSPNRLEAKLKEIESSK